MTIFRGEDPYRRCRSSCLRRSIPPLIPENLSESVLSDDFSGKTGTHVKDLLMLLANESGPGSASKPKIASCSMPRAST